MPADLTRALADVVGARHCLTGADRGPFVVDGRTPCAVVFPGSADEAGRVVAAAAAAGTAVLPWGGGTRMGLGGSPREGAVVVVTRRLARILEHEPGDLTATVEAGVTMGSLQEALGARGQWASLDPPSPGRATLGGVLATNASGPRRYLYGTARDVVIGIRVIGPDGVLVRAGGKVVKNVAGYDLAKLYIGSLGTLGLIVEATLKLRPRPEADRACWAAFDGVAAAAAAARTVMGSDLVPHSIELLDVGAAAICVRDVGVAADPGAALLVGFDGLATTVEWQMAEVQRLLTRAGARSVTALPAAEPALAAVRDVRSGVRDPLALARVTLLPSEVGRYAIDAAALARAAGLDVVVTAHAGNGVVSLVLAAGEAAGAPAGVAVKVLTGLRDHARAAGGELVLEWAPLAVKEDVRPWDTPGPAVRLMERIKARLDPNGVMNPGRYVGDI